MPWEEVTEYLPILQITESSLPDDAAALRMAHLLKMAQDNNSSHVAVLDMLVEQFSNVNQQLAIKTIVRRKHSIPIIQSLYLSIYDNYFRG